MTPTYAQIEAARLAIAKIQKCTLPCACYRNPQPHDCMTTARAALTAAAEVEGQYPNEATLRAVGWLNPRTGPDAAHPSPCMQCAEYQELLRVTWSDARHRQEISESIERCAQVAEAYDGPSGKHGIAAAIRELKDKP